MKRQSMIRPANLSEINNILEITKACAQHMILNGIYQWNEHYPSKAAFENDVKRKELYVMDIAEEIKGGIVISTHMDEEYQPINWLTPSGNNIYIHRLFVHPTEQRKGYAQQLMAYAETKAKEQGYNSVRLDTFSKNDRNNRFYTQRGYQKLGDIKFPKQSKHPFHCYELPFI